jgi:hypothetical protein
MVSNTPQVTLQINLAPMDLRHAREILPHELRQLGNQVDEILLVLDNNRGPRADPAEWERGRVGLHDLADQCRDRWPHLRLVEVDYSPAAAEQVADAFAGGQWIPDKDWRGAPIYAYFFGLWAARHDYIFHMDSDIMYGGGSQTWVAEGVELLQSRTDVLLCSPLPGPPTADGHLTSQTLPREPLDSLAYRADQVSTRLCLLDRDRFFERVRRVIVTPPPLRKVWLARLDGYPPYDCAELLLTRALVESGLARIDFLGRGPGLWGVHPPYRSELFYEQLPSLIERIEAGDVTEAQRGNHDVDDSMIDWSGARKPRWRRLMRHAELGVHNLTGARGAQPQAVGSRVP